MKIEVGTQLRWKGVPVVCTAILTSTEEKLANWSSTTMQSDLLKLGNVTYLDLQIGDFDAGDVIKLEYQRIELTQLGKDLYFLYTYYKARKETKDGSERVEGSTGEASHVEAESSQREDESGKGPGEQSAGQDGNPGDRAGQSGEGGVDRGPQVGEGAKHSVTNNRYSALGRKTPLWLLRRRQARERGVRSDGNPA